MNSSLLSERDRYEPAATLTNALLSEDFAVLKWEHFGDRSKSELLSAAIKINDFSHDLYVVKVQTFSFRGLYE